MTVSLDFETFLISAGVLAPPPVCLTWCSDAGFVPGIDHAKLGSAKTMFEGLWQAPMIVGANMAFDAAVGITAWPDLSEIVFRAYFDGRVRDVQLDQKLIDLAEGRLFGYRDRTGTYIKTSYSLGALTERYGFPSLDKSADSWRLRYSELYDVPLEDWPAAALDYALADAKATLQVHEAQQAYKELLHDGPAQARAHFALHLMSCHGMITDARACDEFIAVTKQDIDNARDLLVRNGLVRAEGKRAGTRDTKKAQAYMTQVCTDLNIEIKKTEKDGVSLDEQACNDTGDEILKAYSLFSRSNAVLNKAEKVKLGSTGVPLQTSFEPLLENGRTSSREPRGALVGVQIQNLPRETEAEKKGRPTLRKCFIPRPGFYFCSVDFNSAELHTFAQVEIWLTGKSRLAEALNSGMDPHCMLAADIYPQHSYEELLANKDTEPFKSMRGNAKAGNFGLPAGMGWKKFRLSENKKRAPKDRMDEHTAQRIVNTWKKSWEVQPYFDYISELTQDGVGTCVQFISKRVRAECDYSAAANTFFSGLAADAAKAGLLQLQYEGRVDVDSPFYGARPVAFIHDEVLAEVPIATAHEAAMRMTEIMLNATKSYVPDVPMKAEPALFTRWLKGSKTVYHEGRLWPCDVPVPESKPKSLLDLMR